MKALKQFVLAALVVLMSQNATAIIINGDFETGDFTGWTQFSTSGGTLGPQGFPVVTLFDTNGDGTNTNSAKFRVGDAAEPIGPQEGGGIFQSFNLAAAGTVTFSLDIAVTDPDGSNFEWGIFSLLIDGTTLDLHQFGSNSLPAGTVLRDKLSADVLLGAGAHEIRILMTRPFTQSNATPVQYLDNITGKTVPEPGVLALLGLGFAGLAATRRSKQ